MKTALFDFVLPPERIATHPVSPRDASRMLVVGKEIVDKYVKDLTDYLRPGDVMVFNDTRVLPARLSGKRGEAKVEITLLKALGDDDNWQAFAKPAKRVRIGESIEFAEGFSATVLAKHETGEIDLKWNQKNWRQSLYKYGKMPLPQYIKREEEVTDKEVYQTVYATKEGAVAAPTAGLHFTEDLLSAIKAKGVKCVYVTLHVGAGTFLPVKSEDTQHHKMHSEYAELSTETADIINETRKNGGRVIAVGTTSLRTLESAAAATGMVLAMARQTDIFITPGYAFKAVDILMTNFHLPRSTLFMLVSAFAGLEKMKEAYQHAIEGQYRFYSYGDACLLLKQP